MTTTQYTLMDLMQQRTAFKSFDPHRPVDDDTLRRLFEIVRLTPSSFNIQHWRFLVLRDDASRQRLLPLAWHQAQIITGTVVMVLADVESYRDAGRFWEEFARQGLMPLEGARKLTGLIETCYDGHEPFKRDEAIRSGAMASMVLMLAASEEGLMSCPIIGFDAKAVCREFEIPDSLVPVLIVALGHAPHDVESRPHPPRLELSEIISEGRLGQTPPWAASALPAPADNEPSDIK